MDRIEQYRELVKQALCLIMKEIPEEPDVRTELILDDARDHYEIMQIGWDLSGRVHGTLVHCDILHDKIYVEHDGTDFGIADFLVEHGVPHKDIVLGFRHPDLRDLTPFAVA